MYDGLRQYISCWFNADVYRTNNAMKRSRYWSILFVQSVLHFSAKTRVHLKLSHTVLPHQTFLWNEGILIFTLTTRQPSRRDDLRLVNCESGIFSFRRNGLCYPRILNAPEDNFLKNSINR
jgi:hypothetical protein